MKFPCPARSLVAVNEISRALRSSSGSVHCALIVGKDVRVRRSTELLDETMKA